MLQQNCRMDSKFCRSKYFTELFELIYTRTVSRDNDMQWTHDTYTPHALHTYMYHDTYDTSREWYAEQMNNLNKNVEKWILHTN